MGLRAWGGHDLGRRLGAISTLLGIAALQLAMTASGSPPGANSTRLPDPGSTRPGEARSGHAGSGTPVPAAAPAPPAPPQPRVSFQWPRAAVSAAPGVATIDVIGPAGTFTVPYIQSQPDLDFALSVDHAPAPVVQVVLDQGSVDEREQWTGPPAFAGRFTDLAPGEHSLTAHLFSLVGPGHGVGREMASTRLTRLARGDIVALLGDSTTEGLGDGPITPAQARLLVPFPDWLAAIHAETAAGTHWVSADGRNFPQAGPTRQPRPAAALTLAETLEAASGHPVLVLNDGFAGTTALAYTHIAASPYLGVRYAAARPNQFLIDLGVNDALQGRSAADYGNSMSAIVSDLEQRFGALPSNIHLACPNWAAQDFRHGQEQLYLPVIDAIQSRAGLGATADFFRPFRDDPSLRGDAVHPDAAGYAAMARWWAEAIGGHGARCA